MNISQQYLQRDILEINGIPNTISGDGNEVDDGECQSPEY